MSDFAKHVASFADKYHRTHGYLPSGPKGPDNTGEPPGGDMLEQRVKHLEDDMKEVKADLKALMKDVAEIKGKLGMLPGWGGLMLVTGFIVTAVGLMLRFMPPAA